MREVSFPTSTAISCAILMQANREWEGCENVHQRQEEFRQSSVSLKKLNLFCRFHLLPLLLFISKYKLAYGSRAQITQVASKHLTTMQIEGLLLIKGTKSKTSKVSMDLMSVRCCLKWIITFKTLPNFSMLCEIAKGAQDAARDLFCRPWLFSIEIYTSEGCWFCRFHWYCTAFLSHKFEIRFSVFILHAFCQAERGYIDQHKHLQINIFLKKIINNTSAFSQSRIEQNPNCFSSRMRLCVSSPC